MSEKHDWWIELVAYVNAHSSLTHPLLMTRQNDGFALVHDFRLHKIVPCNKPAANDN